MKEMIKRTSCLLTVLATCVVGAAEGAYQPAEWNLAARRQFADQRFGIFIHWGLYANYAQGEWYLRNGKTDWKPVTEGLDEEAYSRMMDGFYPSKYDAKEWVKLFKEAGAKYVTFTSRHHEGFSMWHTKADDGYNIANSPFKRDIVGELAKACHDEGMQLNFYYSLLDWHRKDYPPGTCSICVPLKDRKPDYKAYKKFMMAQIGELIDNYKPGLIWFDGEWDHAEHKDGKWVRTLDWEIDDIYDFIHSKKVLIANNNHQPIRAKEDIQAFERDLPGESADGGFSAHQPVVMDRPLEQCDLIQLNVWGWKIAERKFRTPDDVIRLIARAASKGSNLLLNVGPDGSGRIPERSVAVLKDVGKWFKVNGESIYKTDRCPIADGKATVSTRRGNTVYLHFLDPAKNEISFKLKDEIASATYLATGKAACVTRAADGNTTVKINRAHDDKYDVVVKLVLK